ncbi:imelysin family protein [Roseibium sp. CAU 1637]|uniref:Imelysin family protein n=1 Tax=Roseibium limicola TaxID=2816037 RepID=A0A939ERC1_9HYPH|nr:imelysin family protein [Roseibium limicola]MBO0347083.1 imelysin family protein [Roseibium limicola]
MMRTLLMAGLLVVAAAASPAAAQAQAYATYVTNSIDGYIRPRTEAFAAATTKLPAAVEQLCKAPGEDTRAAFADSYRDVLTSFAAVSFLRFGPVIDDNRLDALAFMPDPRGIAQRQIRRAFAKRDETLTQAETLKDKSVALQGLTALQLIAFSKDAKVVLGNPGEGSDFLCGYAGAIAANVERIAADIASDWADANGYAATLQTPDPDSHQVRTSKDAIETIFNAVVTGLIVVKDQDLLPALGDKREEARPHRLPFSRSGDATAYMQAELDGIEAALTAAGFTPDLPKEFSWVPGSLAFEFSNARNILSAADTPLRHSMEDPETYQKLELLIITIDSLRDTAALSLAGAMELSGGFNALDGD